MKSFLQLLNDSKFIKKYNGFIGHNLRLVTMIRRAYLYLS